MLAGCASYHDRSLNLAKTAKTYESRTLDNPELQRYLDTNSDHKPVKWPLDVWGLNALTLAAYYYSPELDAVRAKWGTAAASVVTAGQRPNPALYLPFQYTPASPFTIGQSPWTFGLGLDIPVETAGKRGYRVAQAKQLSTAALFDIGNVAWQVGSRVRTQFLTLYFLGRQASISKRLAEKQSDIVTMLNQRIAVGAASSPEVNQALITLMRNRTDLANMQKQAEVARVQLASAVGIPADALNGIEFRFDAFKRAYPDIESGEAHRLAVLNRADILGALARYQASQAALQLEIANQYPDIHLDPGYAWAESTNQISFGASGITLPVFNRNQGQIAQAEARRAEAEAQVKLLQAQAFGETDSALTNYRASIKILKRAETALTAQTMQLASVQRSFATGATDRLTLALAQQALGVSQLSQEQALMRVQQAIGQLQDAIQRPLPPVGAALSSNQRQISP